MVLLHSLHSAEVRDVNADTLSPAKLGVGFGGGGAGGIKLWGVSISSDLLSEW